MNVHPERKALCIEGECDIRRIIICAMEVAARVAKVLGHGGDIQDAMRLRALVSPRTCKTIMTAAFDAYPSSLKPIVTHVVDKLKRHQERDIDALQGGRRTPLFVAFQGPQGSGSQSQAACQRSCWRYMNCDLQERPT